VVRLAQGLAQDGRRDPNSDNGIFWVLGRHDPPWGPPDLRHRPPHELGGHRAHAAGTQVPAPVRGREQARTGTGTRGLSRS